MLNRVVITGLGCVSSVGVGADATFAALLSGETGIRALSLPPGPPTDVRLASWRPDFDAAAVVGKKNVKRTARFLQLAIGAAREARTHAQLEAGSEHSSQSGTIIGSALGGLEAGAQAIEEFARGGPRAVSPFTLAGSITNMVAGVLAIEAGAKGPCFATTAGWASSAHAICRAFNAIRSGTAPCVVSGGTEGTVHPFVLSLLERTGQFAPSKAADCTAAASRPFDPSSRGSVIGEGSAICVLEDAAVAVARAAPIHAEVLGYGLSQAFTAGAPNVAAMVAAMRRSLEMAELRPSVVDFVQAYGSGVAATDEAELQALTEVFCGHRPSVTCTKAAVGHLLGASSAFDVLVASMSLARQVLPPIGQQRELLNSETVSYVLQGARSGAFEHALVNTFSETGHYGSIVLRRWTPAKGAAS
jgi:3-oxoacyl-[acyl-carrier-protein] synthase II